MKMPQMGVTKKKSAWPKIEKTMITAFTNANVPNLLRKARTSGAIQRAISSLVAGLYCDRPCDAGSGDEGAVSNRRCSQPCDDTRCGGSDSITAGITVTSPVSARDNATALGTRFSG